MCNFEPSEHLIDVGGKWYLPSTKRVLWFRATHPSGQITTEPTLFGETPMVRATIINSEGVLLAVGHAGIRSGQGKVWAGREVEKAETAAIARALKHAGFYHPDEGRTAVKISTETARNALVSGNHRITDKTPPISDTPIEIAEKPPFQPFSAANSNGAPPGKYPHKIIAVQVVPSGTKPSLRVLLDKDRTITVLTRKLFQDAGWTDGSGWAVIGTHIEFKPPIGAQLKQMGQSWDLVAVQPKNELEGVEVAISENAFPDSQSA